MYTRYDDDDGEAWGLKSGTFTAGRQREAANRRSCSLEGNRALASPTRSGRLWREVIVLVEPWRPFCVAAAEPAI